MFFIADMQTSANIFPFDVQMKFTDCFIFRSAGTRCAWMIALSFTPTQMFISTTHRKLTERVSYHRNLQFVFGTVMAEAVIHSAPIPNLKNPPKQKVSQ